MTKHSSSTELQPLSANELDELGSFLLSDNTSDETMQLDMLDGYLTAIAIGPVTLKPSQWIAGVWGPTTNDEPTFDSMEQAQRILELIIRHLNAIISSLHTDAEAHKSIFDNLIYGDDTREYVDAEMWAHGFMRGISLCREDWQPLFDEQHGAEALQPIYLLAADDVADEEDELTATPALREEIAKLIPASVAQIYRHWLPYRRAVAERMVTNPIERDQPKVGRNDPCPCGSGKKFKKCCGGVVLH